MKKALLATAFALSVLIPGASSAASVSEVSSQSVYVGPGGVGVEVHDRYRSERRRAREYGRDRYERRGGGDRTCARLRRACEFKGERGERGEGNCRRYRQVCG